VVDRFHRRGIAVSLFIDPTRRQLKAAQGVGARAVELHTGVYANAKTRAARRRALATLAEAAGQGNGLGFSVAAGHGLDYENVLEVAAIPEIHEMNIGFSIIARALFIGLGQAVREMVALLDASALR
jgi:pyridoxine 5-phosphate synthase